MSLVENYHAAHKARLSRLGAPSPYQAPVIAQKPSIPPQAFDAGWQEMWFFDLVTCQHRNPKTVTVREIQAAVCDYFKIEMAELLSNRRTKEIVRIRLIAYYLSKNLTLQTLPEIGRRFGRDHTSILYGVRKIELAKRTDRELSADIRAIGLKLGAA